MPHIFPGFFCPQIGAEWSHNNCMNSITSFIFFVRQFWEDDDDDDCDDGGPIPGHSGRYVCNDVDDCDSDVIVAVSCDADCNSLFVFVKVKSLGLNLNSSKTFPFPCLHYALRKSLV